MFILALGCVKSSILFFYLRVFSIKTSRTYILLAVLITLVTLWTIAFVIGSVFKCGLRFWAFWGPTVDLMTQCVDTLAFNLALCTTDFIVDVLIIFFPIPLVSQPKPNLGPSCLGCFHSLHPNPSTDLAFKPINGSEDFDECDIFPWGSVGVNFIQLPARSSLFAGLSRHLLLGL